MASRIEHHGIPAPDAVAIGNPLRVWNGGGKEGVMTGGVHYRACRSARRGANMTGGLA